MLASALMQWTSGNFFIISAGGILGPMSVGALKAAQNIMGVSHIIFQGLENIVPAQASYYYFHGGWPRLLNYLKQVTWWGGGGTTVITLLAWVFPEFWLQLLYGAEYRTYGYVLQWYAVTYLLIFIGLPLRAGLRAMECSKPIFISYCLMTAFTAGTAYFFIRNIGLMGAIGGILGTQIICQLNLTYALFRKGSRLTA
jgi:O-antigen/teichoic acid export membrane protein